MVAKTWPIDSSILMAWLIVRKKLQRTQRKKLKVLSIITNRHREQATKRKILTILMVPSRTKEAGDSNDEEVEQTGAENDSKDQVDSKDEEQEATEREPPEGKAEEQRAPTIAGTRKSSILMMKRWSKRVLKMTVRTKSIRKTRSRRPQKDEREGKLKKRAATITRTRKSSILMMNRWSKRVLKMTGRSRPI